MKKIKFTDSMLRKRKKPSCHWTLGCPFLGTSNFFACGPCGAIKTEPMTREQAKSWWKERIKRYNETGK